MKPLLERIQFITSSMDNLNQIEVTRMACQSGLRWIQYRNKEASPKKMWEEGLQLKAVCKEFNATFIINDNPHLAFESGADGVHLGKEDVSVEEARNLIGNKFIIGASCNNIDDIICAQYDGADYVGLGPFRFTKTKTNLNQVIGSTGIEKIMSDYAKKKLTVPVYAIGGVNADDINFFLSIGIYGIAISSLFTSSENWSELYKNLNQKFLVYNPA